jgi:hypothetical protein
MLFLRSLTNICPSTKQQSKQKMPLLIRNAVLLRAESERPPMRNLRQQCPLRAPALANQPDEYEHNRRRGAGP